MMTISFILSRFLRLTLAVIRLLPHVPTLIKRYRSDREIDREQEQLRKARAELASLAYKLPNSAGGSRQ